MTTQSAATAGSSDVRDGVGLGGGQRCGHVLRAWRRDRVARSPRPRRHRRRRRADRFRPGATPCGGPATPTRAPPGSFPHVRPFQQGHPLPAEGGVAQPVDRVAPQVLLGLAGSGWRPAALASTAITAASSSSVGSPLTTLMCGSCGVLRSQWNVPVLLRRNLGDLALQQPQRRGHVTAGVRRRDHRVDIAALGGDVRIDEGVLVVLLQLQPQRVDVLAVLRGLVSCCR